jgi:hypothetical protein
MSFGFYHIRLLSLTVASFACADPAPAIHVVGTDFALQAPESVPAGVTRFQFENLGHVPHELAIGKLRAGVGLEQMLSAAQQGIKLRDAPAHYLDGAPFGVLFAWPREKSPATLTVALEKGDRYALICTLKDSTAGPEHAALGMMRILTVR